MAATVVATDKVYRLASKNIMLTYKTHLAKAEVGTWLRGLGAETVICAHETGDPNDPYPHTHVFTCHIDRWQTRNPRYFDYQGIHPNITKVTTRKHHDNMLRYLAKEDPENAHLKDTVSKNCVQVIWGYDTLREALENVESLRDVIPTIQAYREKPVEENPIEEPETWRPWQLMLLDILSHEPSDRVIHWFIDPVGGSGKSTMSRWLMRGIAKAMVIESFNRTTDFMETLAGALESGQWDGRIVVADLPRSALLKNIYEPLECVKNGHIQTTKWKGKSQYIDVPHVIVFANFPPNRRALSWDRLKVHTIEKDRWTLALDKRDEAPLMDPLPWPLS